MILGIISTFLFIMVCFKYVTKKLKFKKLDKILKKIHIPTAILLLVVSILHIIFVIPYLTSRPLYIIIPGFLILMCFLFITLSGLLRKKIGKKWFITHRFLSLTACILVILHIILNLTSIINYQNKVKNIEIPEIDISQISDGTYIGECDVTFIYVKISVTVKSGTITMIEILEHRNERGTAAEQILNDIIFYQDINVDVITGATNSSIVIQEAIYNALTT